MTRPAVSVVMPFAGSRVEADAAARTLALLDTGGGDELILVDNSPAPVAVEPPDARVMIVRAEAERSPAHARNVGAEHAGNEWILFLDADCRAPAGLLDAYFEPGPADDDVGALAGEVVPRADARTLAARYGGARGFLSQAAHLAHPYRPRAVAANLMVRRSAFTEIGGFYEGVRAGEDTDFSWRLQQAGWRIELRAGAEVEHVYRTTLGQLRRQWRGYAAGRAWLARRYLEFEPEPALRRALSRRGRRSGRPSGNGAAAAGARASRLERAQHLAVDALLGVEELAGLAMSNRPVGTEHHGPVRVVLVAERFPAPDDPLVELARTLTGARVEALARPPRVATAAARELAIDYREDEGSAARAIALARLLTRHPVRAGRELSRDRGGLLELAPAAVRLERDAGARLQALGGEEARRITRRLAMLSGRGMADEGGR
jgi:GT2 family glycosyltransferase